MKDEEEVKMNFKDIYGVLQLAARPESSKLPNAVVTEQAGFLGYHANWWKKIRVIFSLMPKKEEGKVGKSDLPTDP